MISKLSIGAAQFGMHYGISNKNDIVGPKDISSILDYAYANNILLIDTAEAYGKSEVNLGAQKRIKDGDFKLISKVNNLEKRVEESFFLTLEHLNQSKIYGYLLHNFNLIEQDENVIHDLFNLKKKGLVEKIGVSIYHPNQAHELLTKFPFIDIIQLPYSLFDQRFQNTLEFIKSHDVEIHARSIFLQGLVFLDPSELNDFYNPAFKNLKSLKKLSLDLGISIHSLAINFVLTNRFIDHLIIGMSSYADIKQNNSALYDSAFNQTIYPKLSELSIEDENIILPYNWK